MSGSGRVTDIAKRRSVLSDKAQSVTCTYIRDTSKCIGIVLKLGEIRKHHLSHCTFTSVSTRLIVLQLTNQYVIPFTCFFLWRSAQYIWYIHTYTMKWYYLLSNIIDRISENIYGSIQVGARPERKVVITYIYYAYIFETTEIWTCVDRVTGCETTASRSFDQPWLSQSKVELNKIITCWWS